MRGKKAKAIRRANLAGGLPANGRTEGPNITDLPDNREDRRLKTFRKKEYARQMRVTHPAVLQAKAAFWKYVFVWLTMPSYRDGLPAPHEKIKPSS